MHDRARREAARRRKSEREVNLAIRNSSRSNDSWQTRMVQLPAAAAIEYVAAVDACLIYIISSV